MICLSDILGESVAVWTYLCVDVFVRENSEFEFCGITEYKPKQKIKLMSCNKRSNSCLRTQQMLMHDKNMCDPFSRLSILMHVIISLPDATSCDKVK